MKVRFARARGRLSFANVTSVLALFVALGGTSYAAIALPANSVGKSQIRANAVGKSEAATNSIGRYEIRSSGVGPSEIATSAVGASEVRPNAIDSDELANGKIEAVDISDAAKAAINGVKFRVGAAADGTGVTGNAKSVTKAAGNGVYTVDLGADVSKCQSVVTVAGASAPKAFATVDPGATNNLLTISTYEVPGGAPLNAPFNLLVAC